MQRFSAETKTSLKSENLIESHIQDYTWSASIVHICCFVVWRRFTPSTKKCQCSLPLIIQSKCSQNAVKMQSKFNQNAVKMQPKCSQNAVKILSKLVKMQSKFSQNSVKYSQNSVKCSQNAVKIIQSNAVIILSKFRQNSSWSAYRLKSFQSCLMKVWPFWPQSMPNYVHTRKCIKITREIHAASDAIWFLCKYGR